MVQAARMLAGVDTDTFELEQFEFRSLAECSYLQLGCMKQIYIYHNYSGNYRLSYVLMFASVL